MQLFIGLTFSPNHIQFKKIDSFRKRFDEKYDRSHILQMSLFSPFNVEENSHSELSVFVDDLVEECEDHLSGMDHSLNVDFNGFDFHTTKRKGVLFLKPSLPIDLFYCQESLEESIKLFGASFKKRKNLGKSINNDLQTFLPIGRFSDMDFLGSAIEKARVEFDSPFQLRAKDLVLFEKVPGHWIPRKILFSFGQRSDLKEVEESHFSLMNSPANLVR